MSEFKSNAALLIAALLVSQVLMPASQKTPEIYLRDNSDWWLASRNVILKKSFLPKKENPHPQIFKS